MTIKVKIWSRKTSADLTQQVNEFISTLDDEDFISANLTGDNGFLVVYKVKKQDQSYQRNTGGAF